MKNSYLQRCVAHRCLLQHAVLYAARYTHMSATRACTRLAVSRRRINKLRCLGGTTRDKVRPVSWTDIGPCIFHERQSGIERRWERVRASPRINLAMITRRGDASSAFLALPRPLIYAAGNRDSDGVRVHAPFSATVDRGFQFRRRKTLIFSERRVRDLMPIRRCPRDRPCCVTVLDRFGGKWIRRSWRRVEGEGGCQGEEKYVIEEIRSVHFFFFSSLYVNSSKWSHFSKVHVHRNTHRRRRNDSIFILLIAQLFASAI